MASKTNVYDIERYKQILSLTDSLLYLVFSDIMPQALMTLQAYETLTRFMDDCDRATAYKVAIAPESATALGFSVVWTEYCVLEHFGAKVEGA